MNAAAPPGPAPGSAPGHVAVVGAGIVGVSAAIWLRRAGIGATLIDRGPPGEGASFGNAGLLASSAVVPVTVPGLLAKAPRMLLDRDGPLFLRWSYLPRLAPWLVRYLRCATPESVERCAAALRPLLCDSLADHQALAADSAAARYVVPCDYLTLYRDRAAFEADAFAWEVRARHGYCWETLDGEAVRRWDPLLAPDRNFAVRQEGHGRISDPGAYVKALAAQAEASGARLLRAEVEDVVRAEGAVTGLRLRGADGAAETLACDAVVLAAGAWSGGLARRLGLRVPLESERGYHLELLEPTAMPRAPVMLSSAKAVATPMDGRLRIAGLVEFGGLEAGPSNAPLRLLRRAARAAFPGLDWRGEREWMGRRPALTDSIPAIGPVPGLRGAWLGFGHHHVGLTGGPATGRLLARMIAGDRPNIDVAPYDPARFVR